MHGRKNKKKIRRKGPMNVQEQIRTVPSDRTEHFDVIIAGAGISGVGAAYHLTTQCPGTSFVALETQNGFGGTWRTHRYPGIRSDSDLHTFGYRFKPWTSAPIATAAEILSYMGEVIEENGLGPHIRYGHTISSARWSSQENLWTIEAVKTDTGEAVRFTANFFWMVPRVLPPCGAVYARVEGDGELQGPDRPPAGMARRSRLQRQKSHCDRLRRHRGDADPRHRRRMRPCDDAAAFADLFQDRAQRHRNRRDPAHASGRRDLDP
jgi:hypothetical protein